jgi:hypothetical protein
LGINSSVSQEFLRQGSLATLEISENEAERKNDVTALLRLKQEKLELDRKLAGI